MMLHDLRYAVRCLRRAPAFTLGSLMTLSSSIAVIASVFTLGYTLLLRSPAVEDPSSLS